MTNDYHNLKYCCLCANAEQSLLMPWLIWQKYIQLGEDFKLKKRIGEVSISIRHCLVRNPFSLWSSTRAEWSPKWGALQMQADLPPCQAQHCFRKVPLGGGRKGWQGKRGNLAYFNSLFTELLGNYRKCALIQYLYFNWIYPRKSFWIWFDKVWTAKQALQLY